MVNPPTTTLQRPRHGRALLITCAGLAVVSGLTLALLPPGGGAAVASGGGEPSPELDGAQATILLAASLGLDADALTLAGASPQQTAAVVQALATHANSDDGAALRDLDAALTEARRDTRRLADALRAEPGTDLAAQLASAHAALENIEVERGAAAAAAFDAATAELPDDIRTRLSILTNRERAEPGIVALALAGLDDQGLLAASDAVLHTRQAAELGHEPDPQAQQTVDTVSNIPAYANAMNHWTANHETISGAWKTAIGSL